MNMCSLDFRMKGSLFLTCSKTRPLRWETLCPLLVKWPPEGSVSTSRLGQSLCSASLSLNFRFVCPTYSHSGQSSQLFLIHFQQYITFSESQVTGCFILWLYPEANPVTSSVLSKVNGQILQFLPHFFHPGAFLLLNINYYKSFSILGVSENVSKLTVYIYKLFNSNIMKNMVTNNFASSKYQQIVHLQLLSTFFAFWGTSSNEIFWVTKKVYRSI